MCPVLIRENTEPYAPCSSDLLAIAYTLLRRITMKKTRNLFRRRKAQSIDNDATGNEATNLTPDVILECGEGAVSGIVCIPSHDLIAVATLTEGVYIHGYSTQGDLFAFSRSRNQASMGCYISLKI